MRRQECTRGQVARVRSAGAWAAAGSVLAVGTLISGAASAQEVLPKPEATFKGKIARTFKAENGKENETHY